MRSSAVVMPDGLATVARVHALHREGLTGRGVRVTIVDTGVQRSPHFTDRAYRIQGAPEPAPAHGTGMAAALLSIAPDATVSVVRRTTPPPANGLEASDLVLCAWWSTQDPVWENALRPHAGRLVTVNGPADSLPSTLDPWVILGSSSLPAVALPGHGATWTGLSIAAAVWTGAAAALWSGTADTTLRDQVSRLLAPLVGLAPPAAPPTSQSTDPLP